LSIQKGTAYNEQLQRIETKRLKPNPYYQFAFKKELKTSLFTLP